MYVMEFSNSQAAELLRSRGIGITSQRVAVARALFSQRAHLSAEDVFQLVNRDGQHVSKATVYNTLGMLAREGVIREVIADPDRVFYDPNTEPHHHFFDTKTGQLTDIPAQDIRLSSLPSLPQGAELEGVDVIIRLRSAS
jgi:Fur family iron response transcriptional regulator